jgi:predicted nucleic acid-binding protein
MRDVSSADPRVWVVDASVAFGWFVEVPGSTKAVKLLDAAPPARLLAPDLVLVELLNAGWKAWRAGAITEEQFKGIAELAPGVFVELVPAATLLVAAQRWSRRRDHPAYDCLYLALAEGRNGRLITQDQCLLKRLVGDPQACGLAVDLDAWSRLDL